jgi:hypothetical protein
MKKLIPILLLIVFASCNKENLIFQKVSVEQAGELVRVSGYIPEPLIYDFSYSIKVKFCDTWVDFLVVVPAGQVNGYRDYVTDETVACRFSEYKINYEGRLIQ